MMHQPVTDRVRQLYTSFAANEAHDVSPLYEALAEALVRHDELVAFIASLPEAKRQPNLMFAAVRHVCGTPEGPEHFVQLVRQHEARIRSVMLAHHTQTNEPARCATLIPLLASLPPPLALLEVGAAAGLCLLPDRYGYDYGHQRLLPDAEGGLPIPVFPCQTNDPTRIPAVLPEVVWRLGIDLNPIDLTHTDDVAWLETLVWPGQEQRADRLRAAIAVAQADRPTVVQGNLLRDLPRYAAEAPKHATLVVFHTAVLAYLPALSDRDRFASMVQATGAVWISNEAPRVLPHIAAKLTNEAPRNRFLLALDGEPVALTGPHGQSIHWL
jgi:hypothetical protein